MRSLSVRLFTVCTVLTIPIKCRQLFGPPDNNNRQTDSINLSVDEDCTCVPASQCKNYSNVKTAFARSPAMGSRPQCNATTVCCLREQVHTNNKVLADPPTSSDQDNTASESDSVTNVLNGCICVPFYLCYLGVLEENVVEFVNTTRISDTGICEFDNEECCGLPGVSTRSHSVCNCTARKHCNDADIAPASNNGTDIQCGEDQVCCMDLLQEATDSTTLSPTTPEPPFVPVTVTPVKLSKAELFCKMYPLSIACYQVGLATPRPSVKPRPKVNFNPTDSARKLHTMISVETVLIDILTRRTFPERAAITREFQRLFKKNLYDMIQSYHSGLFEDLMLALIRAPHYQQYLAEEMYSAMHRIGTDEDTILETLISSTHDQIDDLKRLYYSISSDHLVDDIIKDFSRHLEDILVAIVQNSRNQGFEATRTRARRLAGTFRRAHEGWGTDEQVFKQYLTRENYPQLSFIFSEYTAAYGMSLQGAIMNDFSGHTEKALLGIVEVTRNLPKYFALRLHHALWATGPFGKDDSSLIRILVSRADIDLASIVDEFKKVYGRNISDDINVRASGAYRRALLSLCHGN